MTNSVLVEIFTVPSRVEKKKKTLLCQACSFRAVKQSNRAYTSQLILFHVSSAPLYLPCYNLQSCCAGWVLETLGGRAWKHHLCPQDPQLLSDGLQWPLHHCCLAKECSLWSGERSVKALSRWAKQSNTFSSPLQENSHSNSLVE